MKTFNIILISFFIVIEVYSQTKFPGCVPGFVTPNPNAFINVMSPQAASFGKYGNIPREHILQNLSLILNVIINLRN